MNTEGVSGSVKSVKPPPWARRIDIGGHRRQREGKPGSGSRSLAHSPPWTTRHSPTSSAHVGPRLGPTHPSPGARAPPGPPSSPSTCRPTGSDDRGAAVEGRGLAEPGGGLARAREAALGLVESSRGRVCESWASEASLVLHFSSLKILKSLSQV